MSKFPEPPHSLRRPLAKTLTNFNHRKGSSSCSILTTMRPSLDLEKTKKTSINVSQKIHNFRLTSAYNGVRVRPRPVTNLSVEKFDNFELTKETIGSTLQHATESEFHHDQKSRNTRSALSVLDQH